VFRKSRVHYTGGALAVLASVLFAASSSHAASINYGNFDDVPPGVVMYLDVTESSGTDPVPLYGAPTAIHNTLDFDPVGFASSSAGGGADVTDGQLNFTAMSVAGAAIKEIALFEGGDFSLVGFGTAVTQVIVSLSMIIEIVEVDGLALVTPIVVQVSDSSNADLVSDAGSLQFWDFSLGTDLDTALVNAGQQFTRGVTKANVVIDNQLVTFSEPSSVAFIAKKDFGITIVPEPTTLALVMLGMLGLGIRRAR
jgi:hypothetical protein